MTPEETKVVTEKIHRILAFVGQHVFHVDSSGQLRGVDWVTFANTDAPNLINLKCTGCGAVWVEDK